MKNFSLLTCKSIVTKKAIVFFCKSSETNIQFKTSFPTPVMLYKSRYKQYNVMTNNQKCFPINVNES